MNRKIQKGVLIGLCCFAVVVSLGAKEKSTRLKDGVLTYSAGHYLEGEPIPVGYDIFDYNYQGHMFEGSYANAYLGRYGYPSYEGDDTAYLAENPGVENTWVWPYRDVYLQMKWNDAWLSNQDRDDDGLLDRHYGHGSYIGSGAWLTNHMTGTNDDGTEWDYFTKIIAVSADATLIDGIWYAADGTEIGPVIWGSFATILTVENDTSAGTEGKQYGSPDGAGLGNL
ncbi:MAG: hypothetical protein ACYSX1_08900 [Planctomycetota bacterium]|jgi:hypothetical protein